MSPQPHRIVLAYSGGLTSSAAIQWLAEKYAAEIITITLDLGQGGELEEVRDRALATGAVRAHVLDVRDELAREFIVRAIKADAAGDNGQPLVAALARPVIARKLAEIAAIEQATRVAHGGAAGTADAGRFDAAIRALNPGVTAIAPAREWKMSRLDLIEYARTRTILTPVTQEQPYAVDATLWGRSVDCTGADPWTEPPEAVYRLTTASGDCPEEPAYVEITFERGAPIAVNGVSMPTTDLIGTIAMIAGAHGVGRIDVWENRGGGIHNREICEAPASVVLQAAHAELQKLAIGREATRFSRRVSRQYADLVDSGLWFSLQREALDAYVDRIQERVTGTIRVKLFKGDCRIVGRQIAEPKTSAKKLRVVAAKTH